MAEVSRPLTGRVALVTGANTGIGLVTARVLAQQGARVFIACRSAARAEAARADILAASGQRVESIPLDLGDLGSVRRAAAQFLDTGSPLHLLVNNAGVAGLRGLTSSGFEVAFGINHVGHFLLTALLRERLEASAPARVITVSSRAHTRVSGIDFDAVRRSTRSPLGIREYQVSKLANVLFSAELARRLSGSGVTTYALHPGVVATEVWRHVPGPLRRLLKLRPMLSAEQGAQTTLRCACDPSLEAHSGRYYHDQLPRPPSTAGRDATLAAELWERSVAWTS